MRLKLGGTCINTFEYGCDAKTMTRFTYGDPDPEGPTAQNVWVTLERVGAPRDRDGRMVRPGGGDRLDVAWKVLAGGQRFGDKGLGFEIEWAESAEEGEEEEEEERELEAAEARRAKRVRERLVSARAAARAAAEAEQAAKELGTGPEAVDGGESAAEAARRAEEVVEEAEAEAERAEARAATGGADEGDEAERGA